jgi:hypothetical protein
MAVGEGLSVKDLKWPSIQFERKISRRIPVKETATGRRKYNKELHKVYAGT